MQRQREPLTAINDAWLAIFAVVFTVFAFIGLFLLLLQLSALVSDRDIDIHQLLFGGVFTIAPLLMYAGVRLVRNLQAEMPTLTELWDRRVAGAAPSLDDTTELPWVEFVPEAGDADTGFILPPSSLRALGDGLSDGARVILYVPDANAAERTYAFEAVIRHDPARPSATRAVPVPGASRWTG